MRKSFPEVFAMVACVTKLPPNLYGKRRACRSFVLASVFGPVLCLFSRRMGIRWNPVICGLRIIYQ